MFSTRLNYRIINSLALIALLYLLVSSINVWLGIIGSIVKVLAPFIIGFAFAYAFTPLVRWIEGKGVSKGIAITIVILTIVLFLGGILWITLPLVYDQLSLLIKMIVEVLNNLETKYDFSFGTYEFKITDYLNTILKDVGGLVSTSGVDFINKTLGFAGKFIVGFVAFIYFLIDMDKIRQFVKEWLQSFHKRSFLYVQTMDGEILKYLKGLEMFMVIQFFEYSFLFLVTGHPNWLVLGILAGITSVIPYFGGLITNTIAIILASVVSTRLFIMTIIICLIFPQLDGYIISPRVYGRTTKVSPLIVIMAVTIGGTIAGVPGIICALPVFLLIRTTYQFFERDLKKGIVIVKRTI